MKNLLLFVFITALFALGSCEKDIPVPEEGNNNSNALLKSTNYAAGWYKVDSKYKEVYQHILQGTNECSWANYVVATAAIVRGKGNLKYPYNQDYEGKIDHCKWWCYNNQTSLGPSGITTIRNYCLGLDAPKYPISCELATTSSSNQTGAVELMLGHISNHHTPFLYIGGVNGYGHYYTVWTIYWTGSLSSSTVFYTNTLDSVENDFDDQIRSENLQTFLNRNVMANNNMLFLY